ncbi:glutaredoxin 3 [Marinimicrobium sp. ABcell2]|uniref:glutaredoxin 3 n=1 Tax=Marinimicrobium sp. ABcell2 TaxID=3069751 RepID=UPI0027AFCCF6|nr:glutaredoxin 3 [Marinimicrobium sp. ABcell2]MDQ2076009.1 glutaredoxin 3 [Marinimicrobium sp. ABcell2]
MKEIVLYTTRYCPFCVNAKALLKRKGITEITEISVDGSSAKREEMTRLTGNRTVPQIYIGDTHVGGFTELYHLEKTGQLDRLLQD